MKNEILTSGLAPKLKDVLQKVKEVLARCACFMVEMVITIVGRPHERGLWPLNQPCSHFHVQPTKQAAKSNIPTAVKPIGTPPHRHALHEALRQNDFVREAPLRAAKAMRMNDFIREGPVGPRRDAKPCG